MINRVVLDKLCLSTDKHSFSRKTQFISDKQFFKKNSVYQYSQTQNFSQINSEINRVFHEKNSVYLK